MVQVFLESVGTPEGDFLVSGVQAAVQRRMAAVWNELEERKARGELVKGEPGAQIGAARAAWPALPDERRWRRPRSACVALAAPSAVAPSAHPRPGPPCPSAGRILNQVWHGYAVGVAGIIAFLPAKQCSPPTARRVGQLQKFRILEVGALALLGIV